MVAIITDTFKRQLVNSLVDEFGGDSHNYYIGLGASEVWDSSDTPPTPTNTEREQRQLRNKLQAIKSVLDVSLVVPRYNWTSGTVYYNFNDNSISHNQRYYVITDTNNVYVCIKQGKDTNGNAVNSTVQPTSTSPTTLTELADGYIWKYLYTISAQDATRFLTANYIPVQYVDSALPTDAYYAQYLVKQAETGGGQIIGYRVTNAGSGYTTPGTLAVTITGNGRGAHAKANITASNTIGSVELDDSAGGVPFGIGYDYANVVISGGGGAGAKAVPIYGPPNGIGYDPTVTLRARAINFNVLADGNEEGVFVTTNDFRQLTLIRDPLQYDSTGSFVLQRGLALKQMRLNTSDDYNIDQLITGANSSAQAYIDYYDGANTIWYHQTEATGFTPFEDGEQVSTNTAQPGSTADSAAINPDFDPYSGEMLYIDNRNISVTRSEDQTEDVKIIIQL